MNRLHIICHLLRRALTPGHTAPGHTAPPEQAVHMAAQELVRLGVIHKEGNVYKNSTKLAINPLTDREIILNGATSIYMTYESFVIVDMYEPYLKERHQELRKKFPGIAELVPYYIDYAIFGDEFIAVDCAGNTTVTYSKEGGIRLLGEPVDTFTLEDLI